jgi:hypothetical protein
VLCAFSGSHLPIYIYRPPNPVPGILIIIFPVLVSALRPPSGVLISPPGSGTPNRFRPLLHLGSCLKNNYPLPHLLPSPTPLAPRRSSEPNSKHLLTRNQICVMTLVERHSHRPHSLAMPYKYTPVSARLGPSPPSYPLTPVISTFPFPLPKPPLPPHLRLFPWNDRNPDCVVRQPSIPITETSARADARCRCTYATASNPFGAYHSAPIIIFPFTACCTIPTVPSIFTATNCRPELRASGGQRPRFHRSTHLFLVVVAIPQSRSHL